MKSLLFTLFIALFVSQIAVAQQASIVLQSGSSTRFFNTLDEAYTAAINGDLIYLPSGSFRMSNVLNKQLNIYGVGWRTDSSAAVGGPTYITTDFNVGKNGANSILSGLNITRNLYFRDSLRNFVIERSFITVVSPYGDAGNYLNSLFINECVVDYAYIPEQGITEFNNSIVLGRINGSGNQTGIVRFRNSIMLNNGNYALTGNQFYIYNSIIFAGKEHGYELAYYATVREISNTLVIGEASRVNFALNGIGNLRKEQTERDNIFVKYTGGSFSIEQDFRPKAACNCADRGVYSGSANFRPIPPIHIASKSVQTSTNNNVLKFTFRVRTDN